MATWTHVGNAPTFSITPKPENKKHFDSMHGRKLMDKVFTISLEAAVDIRLEEFVMDNLCIALFGEVNTAGLLEMGAVQAVERQLKFTGTNDYGANFEILLPHVFFTTDKAINFIGDDPGSIDLTGDALLVNGIFGTIQTLNPTGAPNTPPDPINYYIGKGNVYTSPLDV